MEVKIERIVAGGLPPESVAYVPLMRFTCRGARPVLW